MSKQTHLQKLEESKRWRTVGTEECSNNWVDLYNKFTFFKHNPHTDTIVFWPIFFQNYFRLGWSKIKLLGIVAAELLQAGCPS